MKQAYFFVDDVIWCLRDVTQEKPASIFDNSYFKMLKKCHDEWGMTVQLNIFYRTDFFYGSDEFTLSDMPDTYKHEFEANSDWLKFAFHAKQEFPDYPYINAKYEHVKKDYEQIIGEIKRFAGEKSVSNAVLPHWAPMSREGVQALYDCGVKFLAPTAGTVKEYTGDESVLPYGHAARLRHNRQPETKLYVRPTKDLRIVSSICGYNHITSEEQDMYLHKNTSIEDKIGVRYRQFGGGPCLNLNTVDEIREALIKEAEEGHEFIGVANHEQYYYPEYFAYQPDMPEKFYTMAKTLHDLGYTFITAEDFE